MNKQLIILAVGALLTSSSSVFAGQDPSQRAQTQRVTEAKQQQALAMAARQTPNSPSVAGAKGEEGRIGPTGANTTAPSYGCAFRNQRSGACVYFK